MHHAQTPSVRQKLPSLTKQKSTAKKTKGTTDNFGSNNYVQAYEKENGSLYMKITIPEGVTSIDKINEADEVHMNTNDHHYHDQHMAAD
jgi:hypothetical protein